MKDSSPDHLTLLVKLASEYEQKYKELEELSQNADPELLFQQLKFRAELTTDRFRGAQQFLLSTVHSDNQDEEQVLRAVTTLIRCFDEMRILFQILHIRCNEAEE